MRPVELVHHIKPWPAGSNDLANLRALCRSCHARIHAAQGRP